jgi:hypothetical protein
MTFGPVYITFTVNCDTAIYRDYLRRKRKQKTITFVDEVNLIRTECLYPVDPTAAAIIIPGELSGQLARFGTNQWL